jgi:hypothetical protein
MRRSESEGCLAQRVPVRIRLTDVPAGIPLVSAMTATVTIRGAEARERGGWLRQRFASLADHLVDIVHGPQPSPGCVPQIGDENGATVTLPTPKPIAPLKSPRAKRGSLEKEIHSYGEIDADLRVLPAKRQV